MPLKINKIIVRSIIILLLKIKNKENLENRDKNHMTIKGRAIVQLSFLQKLWNSEDSGMTVSKILKENSHSRILYPLKISSKYKDKIKILSSK